MTAVLALALLAARCGETKKPEPGDPASCPDACEHLAELGCEEATPTPDGATCVEVCENVENSGSVSLNPSCVISVASCAEVDRCVE